MGRPFQLRPSEPPPLVESDVVKQCLDVLRLRQYRPERLHSGRFKSLDDKRIISGHEKGTPDWVVTHSLFPAFYLEVKRPDATPSPAQIKKHQELELNGLAVVWVDNPDALLAWVARHQHAARERWRAALGASC